MNRGGWLAGAPAPFCVQRSASDSPTEFPPPLRGQVQCSIRSSRRFAGLIAVALRAGTSVAIPVNKSSVPAADHLEVAVPPAVFGNPLHRVSQLESVMIKRHFIDPR